MKQFKPLYYICAAICLTGCSKEHSLHTEQENSTLHVTAHCIPMEAATRGSIAEPELRKDTLWLNDSVYIDAIVSDYTSLSDEVVTRGKPIESVNDFTSMKVLLFARTGGGYEKALPVTKSLDVKASNGNFTFDTPYEWFADEPKPHTLFAIAPLATSENGLTLNETTRTIDYTVPEDVKNQPDLCLNDYRNNMDMLNPAGSNNQRQKFVMKHYLTAVGFDAVGWDLSMSSITIDKITTKSTFDMHELKWAPISTNEKIFSPIIKDNNWMKDESVQQWKSMLNPNGYLMMIPQELGDKTLTFKYKEQNEQLGLGPGEYTVKLKDIPGASDWTPGKKVTYRLRLRTRPAVLDDKLIINWHLAGYGSDKALTIAADPDDDLTFTWDADWLKIYQGNGGKVDIANKGFASGWQTGVNNFKNIHFASSNDHKSLINSRTATVTVVGTKSGRRTFKVEQKREWHLRLFNEGEVYINDFKQGTMVDANQYWIEGGDGTEKVTISFDAQGWGKAPADRNWMRFTETSGNDDKVHLDITHRWNIQANLPRSTTVTVTAKRGDMVKTKSFTVKQRASSFWIVTDESGNIFRVAVAVRDLSGHYFGDEEYRCAEQGLGNRLPTATEAYWIGEFGVYSYWKDDANYKWDTEYYWTSSDGILPFGKNYVIYYFQTSSNGKSMGFFNLFRKTTRKYRCVLNSADEIY